MNVNVPPEVNVAMFVSFWTVNVPLLVRTLALLMVNVEAAAEAQLHVDLSTRESGYVRSLAGRLADKYNISTGFEVLHIKDPARAVLDFTGHDGIVVMSTHGRSGLSRLFAGSVAHEVVAGSHRPVVVCRPADAG